jgi:dihydroorotate dehydrogenase subfamily 2
MKKDNLYLLLVIMALVGVMDAGYLTYEKLANVIPPCSIGIFADCGKVLGSSYAMVLGVPLAMIGLVFYAIEFVMATGWFLTRKKEFAFGLLITTTGGLLGSIYFVFLQLVIIKAICQYCMVSALVSLLLFIATVSLLSLERKKLFCLIVGWIYRNILKPLLFLFDPTLVHLGMTSFGEGLGSWGFIRAISKWLLVYRDKSLQQELLDIKFANPIGLSAGFDYEAKLTQILPSIGFGFQSIGTITNNAYEGNPPPMLGRLPKSKSLMVNKGYKNEGAKAVIKKLKGRRFDGVVGISIGRTNGKLMTQAEAVKDIVEAFTKFEKANLNNKYYELNISCPNLIGSVTFYPPKELEQLLKAVDKVKLSKPLLIKMPIEKTDKEVKEMLQVIVKHNVRGVIFGNLQKNRQDPSLDPNEVAKFPKGNFSGKPTEKRSDELIKFAYKTVGKKLLIVGCGGVFSAEDAYRKIKLGASLIQLITGMIYEGPQMMAEINLDLVEFLRRDGYRNVSEAVGGGN